MKLEILINGQWVQKQNSDNLEQLKQVATAVITAKPEYSVRIVDDNAEVLWKDGQDMTPAEPETVEIEPNLFTVEPEQEHDLDHESFYNDILGVEPEAEPQTEDEINEKNKGYILDQGLNKDVLEKEPETKQEPETEPENLGDDFNDRLKKLIRNTTDVFRNNLQKLVDEFIKEMKK